MSEAEVWAKEAVRFWLTRLMGALAKQLEEDAAELRKWA